MRELKLGSWIIRVLTKDYTLWSNEDKVMIEFKSEKIVTISIDEDNNLSVDSRSSICNILSEQKLITVAYSDDPNIAFN